LFNSIIIIIAWRIYKPSTLRFLILALFVGVLIVEFGIYIWKFHSLFFKLFQRNGDFLFVEVILVQFW
jgi:hypothetical protein